MAGNMRDKRRRVREQAEQAQEQDKMYPWAVHQATVEKGYDEKGAYAEYAQNITESRNTRQGRQYWLRHDMEQDPGPGKPSTVHQSPNNEYVNKENARKRYEQEKKRKKQGEIADRLLKKGKR